jgi:glucan phosphoethanolaminetransferase (alkaline phosphatase superfamily)
MNSLLNSMEFGLKTYMKEGAFGVLKNMKKSSFGSTGSDQSSMVGQLIALVLLVVLVVYGFLAVKKICRGSDLRSQNIRLGMYALLILTGGRAAMIFIVLWLLKVNVM